MGNEPGQQMRPYTHQRPAYDIILLSSCPSSALVFWEASDETKAVLALHRSSSTPVRNRAHARQQSRLNRVQTQEAGHIPLSFAFWTARGGPTLAAPRYDAERCSRAESHIMQPAANTFAFRDSARPRRRVKGCGCLCFLLAAPSWNAVASTLPNSDERKGNGAKWAVKES